MADIIGETGFTEAEVRLAQIQTGDDFGDCQVCRKQIADKANLHTRFLIGKKLMEITTKVDSWDLSDMNRFLDKVKNVAQELLGEGKK